MASTRAVRYHCLLFQSGVHACRYDVYWTPSDIEWASRWDAYLAMPNGSVHWFSILNSLLVVLVMSVIVAVILMRTVRRDLAKYEELLVEGQARPLSSIWYPTNSPNKP